MSRRPATFTQADVARAIRAAKQEGAAEVEVRPDGGIVVRMVPSSTEIGGPALERSKEIIL
jgi:hypothetical protein